MNQTESAQASPKAHASFFQVMKAVLWSMLGVRQQGTPGWRLGSAHAGVTGGP